MKLWIAALVSFALVGCSSCERSSPVAVVIDAGKAGPTAAELPQGVVTPAVERVRAADAALQKGNLDLAIDEAEKAIVLEPSHALANNVLGRAAAARFEKSKDPIDAQKARDAFTRALQQNPEFWPAHQNLAELAEKQGKLEEAAEHYRQVLKAQPDHPEKARFQQAIDAAAKP